MSNEIKQLVKKIKFLTDKTVEEIGKSIGYSREYFTQEVNKGVNEEIKRLLTDYLAQVDDGTFGEKKATEPEILQYLKSIDANLTDTKSNVLYNQAIGKATLRFLALKEAEKHEDIDAKFLELIRSQAAEVDDILLAIRQARSKAIHNGSTSLKENGNQN